MVVVVRLVVVGKKVVVVTVGFFVGLTGLALVLTFFFNFFLNFIFFFGFLVCVVDFGAN